MMTPDYSSSVDNNNQSRTPSVIDTNSIDSSVDGGQLSTVFEVPQRNHGEELRQRESSSVTGLPASTQELPANHSRDASPRSTAEQSCTEKLAEVPPRRLKHKPQSISARERDAWLKDAGPLPNGTYEDTMTSKSPVTTATKKLKTRGLGTIIRRMFGRRSKDRISMPGPESFQNDPNSFITSAADLSKVPRASSAPSQDISRSSALGSHAPYSARVPPNIVNVETKIPPRPERSPERPTRLRQSSLPIASLNVKDQEVSNVQTEFGLQTARDNAVHTANTEFVITNSKRRSRSAGASHDTAREHRMSPIQWRQFRRRSAEIRYWRESTDAGSPLLGNTTFIGSDLLQMLPVHPRGRGDLEESSAEASDGLQTGIERNHENFNFGVPISELEPQEQVSIEERMVTLEIKLMDFEYAISKLQAGLASSSQPSHQFYPSEEPRTLRHSNNLQIRPVSSRYHAKRPSDESYNPVSSHSTTVPSFQRHFQSFTQSSYQQHHNENRPVSASTTVKAGARDRSTRLSFTALTIDHYTTLITLIRHEQSARLRLEDQVLLLERQIQQLQASPWPQHENSLGVRGGPRRRLSSPLDVGEHSPQGRYRRPSHAYSEGEMDTDEQSFHDVYVTPAERGEFERARLAAEEEGVAF